MKTIDHWYDIFIEGETLEDDKAVIADIQKDAYDQAIIDVFNKMGDIAELILKLKKEQRSSTNSLKIYMSIYTHVF